jgi:hypothetical protein
MRGFDMFGSSTCRILVTTACLCGSRHSRATRREAGWGMPAEASELSPLVGLLWDLQQFADLQPGLPQLVGLWWVVDLRGGSSTVIELLMTLS